MIVGAVMLVAAVAKALDLAAFAQDVSTLSFLSRELRRVLPMYVPLAELGCVAMLLFRKSQTFGLWVILCILLVFTGVLLWKWTLGKPPCQSCMGSIRLELTTAASHKAALIRNVILLALTTIAIALRYVASPHVLTKRSPEEPTAVPSIDSRG